MEKVLASPTKHAAYLAKENKRKEAKALQTQTMSERDTKNQKRKWTLAQRTYLRKCKEERGKNMLTPEHDTPKPEQAGPSHRSTGRKQSQTLIALSRTEN